MTNYYNEQESNNSPFYETPKRNAGNDAKNNKVVFNEKNYLNTRLANGETTRTVKIRILPVKPGTNKIALPISIHSLKVDKQVAQSGFKTFLCLNDGNLTEHDQRGCPICNKSKELFDTANLLKLTLPIFGFLNENFSVEEKNGGNVISEKNNPSAKVSFEEVMNRVNNNFSGKFTKSQDGYDFVKRIIEEWSNGVQPNVVQNTEKHKALCKEAFKYQPKTAYIVRVIERGKEDEGVKFWRFNHWDNGKGCKDQLENLYNLRKEEMEEAGVENFNIFDLHNGKDIVLTLTKSQKENSHIDKTEITITDAGICTPLSKDENKIEEWVNDPKDWKDMYACKDFKYLEIVSDGEIPVYSPEQGCYVAKDIKELQDSQAELEAAQEVRNGAPKVEDSSLTSEDNEDDLPF